MRMWFEARHFSWHWCYLLFILVPVSWKNQSHSKKNVVAKQASETFDLERSCRFCFCGQNVQQNCKRTSNDIENVENGERTIDSGEYVSGLSRKTFVNIPRHWNVFYVDFNDLTLLSFLRVIWCAFFTSLQFNCFFKELVLNHLLHKVGDLRSIGMLASKLLLNQI